MAAIVVSAATALAGLWLVVGDDGSSQVPLVGAMLLVLGLTFLAVNLYLRRHGFSERRRRP